MTAQMASIPMSWLILAQSFDAKSILQLHKEVEKRKIAHDDLPAVKAVWDELHGIGPGPSKVMDWGQEVRAFRRVHGLSKAAFGKLVPISVQAVSSLENGSFKRPVAKEAALRRVLWGTKS